MRKRIVSLICILAIVVTSFAWVISAGASAIDENAVIIQGSDIPLVLKYDEEAPFINENSPAATMHDDNQDKGWNNWSLPLGNGYFGVSAFGRTETERLQITEKTLSNLREVKARGARVLAVTAADLSGVFGEVGEVLPVPTAPAHLSAIPQAVVLQLLAYYTARERGCDIDKPRNLAKSVTVE